MAVTVSILPFPVQFDSVFVQTPHFWFGFESLQLCVEAKVMLKHNQNVEAGLVNRSVRVITGFISQNNNLYTWIFIKPFYWKV